MDRFNPDAKRALALAQSEAMRLNHSWLGTEHLMLGLLRDGSGTGAVLSSLGIDLSVARAAVEQVIPKRDVAPTEIPLTPRMQRILARANEMSPAPTEITPRVLLRALVADPDGVGPQVLAQLGATPEKIREAVDRLTPPS